MKSILTKNQKKKFGPKVFTENGETYRITAYVRYDDECNNGYNTFSITGEIDRKVGNRWVENSGGCIHEEIEKHFPELKKYIKWHLVSSDGPLHYIANTLYHARENGVTKWYVAVREDHPLSKICGTNCQKYVGSEERRKIEQEFNGVFNFLPDEKTAKDSNLRAARSTAIWPDATLEQLQDKKALEARLPGLMKEFKKDVEELGFVF